MNTAFTNVIINQTVRDQFIMYLKSKQLAEGTISRYIYHISLLAQYAGDLIRDLSHFLRFRDYIQEKNLRVDTVNNIYTSINKFMDYLHVGWHLVGEKVQRQAFIPPNRFLTLILEEVLCFMKKRGISAYDEATGKGTIRHLMLRKAFSSGEIMAVIVSSAPELPYEDELASVLGKFESISFYGYIKKSFKI